MVFDGVKILRTDDLISSQQLFVRVASGNLTALARYLAKGGKINARHEDGLTLIHYAACRRDIQLIRRLKDMPCEVGKSHDFH